MQSRQGLTSPVGFTGYIALLPHGVGSICGSRMSPSIMLSRATEMASLLSIGPCIWPAGQDERLCLS